MKEEEGLFYSCSENKGTDQLRGKICAFVFAYADCLVFPCSGSNVIHITTKPDSREQQWHNYASAFGMLITSDQQHLMFFFNVFVSVQYNIMCFYT